MEADGLTGMPRVYVRHFSETKHPPCTCILVSMCVYAALQMSRFVGHSLLLSHPPPPPPLSLH